MIATRSILPATGLATLLVALAGCAEPAGRASTPAESPLPAQTDPEETTVMDSSDEPAASEHADGSPSDSAASTEGDAGSAGGTEVATLGAGCFWCVEAVLEQVEGIRDVVSGYMGGSVENPTYEEVCTGTTGHAEVVQVTFDPAKLRYEEVLAWFWRLHDPTTLNRQGNDVGTQYRSVIFHHDEAQREAAEKSKAAADASGELDGPIVTEIAPAGTFYEAEDYHQDYYRENPSAGYCRYVIAPKLDKLDLEK